MWRFSGLATGQLGWQGNRFLAHLKRMYYKRLWRNSLANSLKLRCVYELRSHNMGIYSAKSPSDFQDIWKKRCSIGVKIVKYCNCSSIILNFVTIRCPRYLISKLSFIKCYYSFGIHYCLRSFGIIVLSEYNGVSMTIDTTIDSSKVNFCSIPKKSI